MMIDSAPFRGGGGRWTTSSSDELNRQQRLWLKDEQESDQCAWEPGMPVLFNVEHSKMHADGEEEVVCWGGEKASGDHVCK